MKKAFQIISLTALFSFFGIGRLHAGTQWYVPGQYATIQAAIDAVTTLAGDQILVSGGPYNLLAPIKVTKGVTITGDISNPANVVINAPTSPSAYPSDKDCFQVLADNVTIEGFTIQGAKNGQPLNAWGYQNAGIFVGGDWADIIVDFNAPVIGIKNTVIRYNDINDNSYGIYVYRAQHLTISDNKIRNSTFNGNWSGKGIQLYSQDRTRWPAYDPDPSIQIFDVKILNNEIFDNALFGIELNSSEVAGNLDVQLLIDGNTIFHNGGPGDLIWGPPYPYDIYRGICANGTADGSETGVIITNNSIFNHFPASGPRCGRSSALCIQDPKNWVINNNNIFNNLYGLWLYANWDDRTLTNTIEGNEIHDNVQGILIMGAGEFAGKASNNRIYDNNIAGIFRASGPVPPYGIKNETTLAFDATNNWWGDATGPLHLTSWPYNGNPYGPNAGLGDEVSDYVLYDPWTGKMESFLVEEAKVDFKKKADDDKIHVKGTLVFASGSAKLADSEMAYFTIHGFTGGAFMENVPIQRKGKEDKWEYKRPKGVDSGIKNIVVDFKKKEIKFDIHVDNAEIGSAWTNPVFISLKIGDNYGQESITMDVKKDKMEYHNK